MHCKHLRTEYMKRFKDPHWDAHRKCYEEMLRYRLARRLLEHAHKPWLWEGWEGSSDSSSGHSTPPTKPSEPAPATHQAAEAAQVSQKLPHTDDPDVQPADPEVPTNGHGPFTQENTCHNEKNTELDEKSVSRSRPQLSQRASSRKDGQKSTRSPEKTNLTKESRHAFALYACGEREKDTGSQKTHNVCAPTQENEVCGYFSREKSIVEKGFC